jgi:hypothetical protein
MRVNTHACPQQQATFIFTTQEADHAARMWFAQRVPAMTLADWRDHRLSQHLAGLHVEDWQERTSRTKEWNHAFAASIAAEIVLGGARHG